MNKPDRGYRIGQGGKREGREGRGERRCVAVVCGTD
jgi:hypothetical protein